MVRECITNILDPIGSGLADKDPYVRKTAAMAAAKLVKASPLGEQLINGVQNLLRDSNATVVSSAIMAMMDIHLHVPQYDLVLDSQLVSNLLSVITECNE